MLKKLSSINYDETTGIVQIDGALKVGKDLTVGQNISTTKGSLTLHDGDVHCGNVYAMDQGLFAGFKKGATVNPSTASSGLRKDGIFAKGSLTLHSGDVHCGNVYAMDQGFFAGFDKEAKVNPSNAYSGLRKDGIFTYGNFEKREANQAHFHTRNSLF